MGEFETFSERGFDLRLLRLLCLLLHFSNILASASQYLTPLVFFLAPSLLLLPLLPLRFS